MSHTSPVNDPALSRALAEFDQADLVIYAGPSLADSPLTAPAAHLILPPVRDGDLTALLTRTPPPTTVLMIDGYFGAGQAVSLTEIQETLGRGVRLYGCSSMGALRAVEARPWGMIGLGVIFTDYLTGRRTADENVALLHDDHYRSLTAPTVNVDLLCTLLAAEGVSAGHCEEFRRRARELYFGDRSYSALRQLARTCFASGSSLAPGTLELVLHRLTPPQLAHWDAKRHDAESAIRDVVLGLAPTSAPTELIPVPECIGAMLAEA
ncbi:TfuA-like protein [Streptomyces sp. TG1A-8]|uniref:TfuA-like protein n=1 Tax=Streptomyces sp. TG1A-8 TaxID=3051385 RepID=UPI00265C6539|nr:TfuA-like protein [Streptomyces sp. TG1A-8]MDO0924063.1 TfuA-like protein [Streptomyces sp. TG1A-8]